MELSCFGYQNFVKKKFSWNDAITIFCIEGEVIPNPKITMLTWMNGQTRKKRIDKGIQKNPWKMYQAKLSYFVNRMIVIFTVLSCSLFNPL